MFYKAQEILQQRMVDFSKQHPRSEDPEYDYFRYESSARRQRELELQSKYGVVVNEI